MTWPMTMPDDLIAVGDWRGTGIDSSVRDDGSAQPSTSNAVFLYEMRTSIGSRSFFDSQVEKANDHIEYEMLAKLKSLPAANELTVAHGIGGFEAHGRAGVLSRCRV